LLHFGSISVIRTILAFLVEKGTIKKGFAGRLSTEYWAFVRLSSYISFHARLNQLVCSKGPDGDWGIET
jgi:hypothetical protein